METRKERMEILDVILAEVQHVRKEQGEIRTDLKEHIKEDRKVLDKMKGDIHCLSTRSALNKQQAGFITAAISTIVAVIVSWFTVAFRGGS